MGRSLSLFLMRATGIVLAGHAALCPVRPCPCAKRGPLKSGRQLRPQTIPRDNYDTVPPGAGIAPPPASARLCAVPGTSVGPNGTYSTLNGAPQSAPAQQPQSPAAEGYQPVPQQRMAPLQQPQRLQPPQTSVSQQQAPVQPAAPAYGYRPLPQQAQQPQMPTEPYGYRPMPGVPNNVYRPATGERHTAHAGARRVPSDMCWARATRSSSPSMARPTCRAISPLTVPAMRACR